MTYNFGNPDLSNAKIEGSTLVTSGSSYTVGATDINVDNTLQYTAHKLWCYDNGISTWKGVALT